MISKRLFLSLGAWFLGNELIDFPEILTESINFIDAIITYYYVNQIRNLEIMTVFLFKKFKILRDFFSSFFRRTTFVLFWFSNVGHFSHILHLYTVNKFLLIATIQSGKIPRASHAKVNSFIKESLNFKLNYKSLIRILTLFLNINL